MDQNYFGKYIRGVRLYNRTSSNREVDFMDLGIQAKLYEYENMYENLKQGASKKEIKQMKRLLDDVKYYIKKEAKSDNYTDLYVKYQNMYNEIAKKV